MKMITNIWYRKWRHLVQKMDSTKETTTKETTTKENTTTAEQAPQDVINPLIELFKPINPSYERLFSNKSQRGALERLVKKHGAEKVVKIIGVLPRTNPIRYAPSIT